MIRVQGTLAFGAVAGATVALILASPAGAGVERATATAKTFRNCTALNRVYPHGVGRVGADTGRAVRRIQPSSAAICSIARTVAVTATRTESPARRREPGVDTILIRAAAVLLLALVATTVAPNASGSPGSGPGRLSHRPRHGRRHGRAPQRAACSPRADRHAGGVLRHGVLRAAGVGHDQAIAPGGDACATFAGACDRSRGRLRATAPLRRPSV